jgi:hypothetical protein
MPKKIFLSFIKILLSLGKKGNITSTATGEGLQAGTITLKASD